jgi:hypothetical protein
MASMICPPVVFHPFFLLWSYCLPNRAASERRAAHVSHQGKKLAGASHTCERSLINITHKDAVIIKINKENQTTSVYSRFIHEISPCAYNHICLMFFMLLLYPLIVAGSDSSGMKSHEPPTARSCCFSPAPRTYSKKGALSRCRRSPAQEESPGR